MTIWLAILIMLFIVCLVCVIGYFILTNALNDISISIVKHFEEGLDDDNFDGMIEYHKNNEVVDYSI